MNSNKHQSKTIRGSERTCDVNSNNTTPKRIKSCKSNHIFNGRRVQKKNSLPYSGDTRKNYKPTQKKKKKTMRERERELTYSGVGNMD